MFAAIIVFKINSPNHKAKSKENWKEFDFAKKIQASQKTLVPFDILFKNLQKDAVTTKK